MRVWTAIGITLLLAGCALFGGKKDTVEEWSEEKLHGEAKEALQSEYYERAIEYYEKLQTRYPFGEFSKQAQLDLAYAYYKTDETASTIAACDRFIKLYPTSPQVDYAYYLKGLANFNQGKGLAQRYLPTDPSQRDPGASLQAFQDFTELAKRFPNSRYLRDARKRMMYLRNILAQHEVNVANFYMWRGAYLAAANRALYVVENYQQAPVMPDALSLLIRAYKALGLEDLAADAMRVLDRNYPRHPAVGEVRELVVR